MQRSAVKKIQRMNHNIKAVKDNVKIVRKLTHELFLKKRKKDKQHKVRQPKKSNLPSAEELNESRELSPSNFEVSEREVQLM